MGVKRIGPPSGEPPANLSRQSPSGTPRDFKQVISQKQAVSQSSSLGDEARVKNEMATVLRGGGDRRQAVNVAIRNHPLFRDLPARAQEDLIRQVSATMTPVLKKG